MPFILHLGVVDIPYATAVPSPLRRVSTKARRTSRRRWTDLGHDDHAPRGGETTGDVAQRLEDKYHIMEVFAEDVGGEKIAEVLARSAANAVESLMMGAPRASLSLTAEGLGEIEAAFKLYLSLQLMDGLVPGVPTQAALKGINHRFKHPYAKANPERPSFIDTGTYQASFKAWMD